METIDYTTAILWYATWPLVIYVSYKFIRVNIEHLEENLENKD
jgi:hypothetical protein